MTKPLHLTLLLSCAIILVGCNEDAEEEAMDDFQDTELINNMWMLQSIEVPGATTIEIDSNKVFSIQFSEDNQFSGMADCNSYYGTYTISNTDSLNIVPIGITYVGCDHTLDQEYFYILHFIHSYEIINNVLRLYYDENNSVLNYIKDM